MMHLKISIDSWEMCTWTKTIFWISRPYILCFSSIVTWTVFQTMLSRNVENEVAIVVFLAQPFTIYISFTRNSWLNFFSATSDFIRRKAICKTGHWNENHWITVQSILIDILIFLNHKIEHSSNTYHKYNLCQLFDQSLTNEFQPFVYYLHQKL